jgi:hypothetical protein
VARTCHAETIGGASAKEQVDETRSCVPHPLEWLQAELDPEIEAIKRAALANAERLLDEHEHN